MSTEVGRGSGRQLPAVESLRSQPEPTVEANLTAAEHDGLDRLLQLVRAERRRQRQRAA